MAITGFTAEKSDSGDQIFAVLKTTSDSFLYPVGFNAWGDSGSINITSTSAPLPAQLFGHSSANPVFVGNNSAHPVFVRDENATAVTISAAIPQSSVTVASGSITVVNDTGDLIGVSLAGIPTAGNDGGAIDSTNSAIRVNVVAGAGGNDTTVTVAALSTASIIRIQQSSAEQIFVQADSNNPVFVRDENSTSVTASISGTPDVAPAASTAQNGATPWMGTVSSAASLVIGDPTRLRGYHIFNPDSAGNAYLKIYNDTAVVLGTDSAVMDLGIPFGGGAVNDMSVGLNFSAGISLAAAGAAGSTDHTAPSTSLVVTVWYD